MKEFYNKPQAKIEEFKLLDVITTSVGDGTNPEPDTDVPWGT